MAPILVTFHSLRSCHDWQLRHVLGQCKIMQLSPPCTEYSQVDLAENNPSARFVQWCSGHNVEKMHTSGGVLSASKSGSPDLGNVW